MVNESKVIEMKDELRKENDRVEQQEKDTKLKEYEDTLGY